MENCLICTNKVTKAYNMCSKKHILCFDCILKHSEKLNKLSCICGEIVNLHRLEVLIDPKRIQEKHKEFYRKVYERELYVINGKKVHISRIQNINSQLNYGYGRIEKEVDKYNNIISKLYDEKYKIKLEKPSYEKYRLINDNCIDDKCDGKIISNICNKCEIKICPKCELKEHEGGCHENDIKSVKFLISDPNICNCPSCGIKIEKDSGCEQLTCKCGNKFIFRGDYNDYVLNKCNTFEKIYMAYYLNRENRLNLNNEFSGIKINGVPQISTIQRSKH